MWAVQRLAPLEACAIVSQGWEFSIIVWREEALHACKSIDHITMGARAGPTRPHKALHTTTQHSKLSRHSKDESTVADKVSHTAAVEGQWLCTTVRQASSLFLQAQLLFPASAAAHL